MTYSLGENKQISDVILYFGNHLLSRIQKLSRRCDDCNEIRPGVNKTSHYMLDMTRYICSSLSYTTYIVKVCVTLHYLLPTLQPSRTF